MSAMLKKHLLFTVAYLVLVGFNLFAFGLDNDLLKLIAMPLIGISNILYLLIMTRLRSSFSLKIFLSMLFAMGGDIMLLFNADREFSFFTAIIATFSGYLMAIFAFAEDKNKEVLKSKWFFYLSIAIISLSTTYYLFLRSHLGDLKTLVLIHFFILTMLLIAASFRYNSINAISFIWVMASAVCFLISDYSIAYSSFIHTNKGLMLLYIFSYMLAQFSLAIGTIERRALLLQGRN